MPRDRRRRHDGKELQPCVRCGAPKSRGQGRRYCDECRELARWKRNRKYHARALLARQPCQRCGARKPPGHGRRLCDACAALPPRLCLDCGAEIERPFFKCDACKAVSKEREREGNRRRTRERRRRERAVGQGRRPRNKVTRRVDNEARRMKRREKLAAVGRELPPVDQEEYERRYGAGYGRGPTVPAAPLTRLLEVDGIDFQAIAESAGLDSALLYGIARGARERVTVRAADRLCVALDVPFSLLYTDAA